MLHGRSDGATQCRRGTDFRSRAVANEEKCGSAGRDPNRNNDKQYAGKIPQLYNTVRTAGCGTAPKFGFQVSNRATP